MVLSRECIFPRICYGRNHLSSLAIGLIKHQHLKWRNEKVGHCRSHYSTNLFMHFRSGINPLWQENINTRTFLSSFHSFSTSGSGSFLPLLTFGSENTAKDRKVIPDPIDDRKFQEWKESGKSGILLGITLNPKKCIGEKVRRIPINVETKW